MTTVNRTPPLKLIWLPELDGMFYYWGHKTETELREQLTRSCQVDSEQKQPQTEPPKDET